MRREDFIEMYFQRLSNIENLTEIADLFGNRYVFPNSHGKYWFYRVSLEEGMDITFTSLPNRLNYSFESENWQEEVLELGVCTEGSMEILCYPSLEKYSIKKDKLACIILRIPWKDLSFLSRIVRAFPFIFIWIILNLFSNWENILGWNKSGEKT